MTAAPSLTATRSPASFTATEGPPGRGLAILVNANAKRGGRRVAVQIAHSLPGASVCLTRSPGEIDAWLRVLTVTRGVLAAGGDGSAIALVNALARLSSSKADAKTAFVVTQRTPPHIGTQPWTTTLAAPNGLGEVPAIPAIGVLPLGTGNGWAHALGAPHLDRCLQLLATSSGPLPTHFCGLVDIEGTLAHFAGSGWDAMILEDYKRQLALAGRGRFTKSVYGYISAALLRTAPKVALSGNPLVVVENLGDRVYAIGDDGRPRLLPRVERGTVLYEGPAGTASVGTCPEYGYRFRAFPFAERIPGFMNVRVYAQNALGAVSSIAGLWKGAHPIPGMHDWLATHVRMTFSRPVPLQVGGDAFGQRQTIEYRAAASSVPMLDWRRLSACNR